jgi:hypothetical protein
MWNDRQPPTSFCDAITGPSCANFYLTLYLLGWFFKTISLDTSTSCVCCSFLVGKFCEWKKQKMSSVLKNLSIIVVFFWDGGFFYYTIRRELCCFGVNNTEWKYLVNMCNPASWFTYNLLVGCKHSNFKHFLFPSHHPFPHSLCTQRLTLTNFTKQ